MKKTTYSDTIIMIDNYRPNIPYGIWSNMRLLVSKSKIMYLLVVCLLLDGVRAVVNWLMMKQSLLLVDPEITTTSAIKILIFMWFLNTITQWIWLSSRYLKSNVMFKRFKKTAMTYYLDLVNKGSMNQIRDSGNDKINSEIDSGIESMIITLETFMSMVFSIFQSVLSMYLLISAVGKIGMWMFVVFFVLFVCGIMVMRKQYISGKEIDKETKSTRSYLNKVTSNFFIEFINGRGNTILKRIIGKTIEIDEKTKRNKIKTYVWFCVLDNVHDCLVHVFIILIFLSGTVIIQIAILYNIVQRTCGNIWNMFYRARDVIDQVSKWGSLEEFLINYEGREFVDKVYLSNLSQLDSILPEKTGVEVGIFGSSGTGKTVNMRRLVCLAAEKFENNWIYLDQFMAVLKSELVTIREYMTEFVPNSYNCDILLCEWAEKLKINSVINVDTLGEPFVLPSGGEQKRILILRAMIPILTKSKDVKFIFSDEATANLDDANWKLARGLFDMLKKEYGVTIVSIDHNSKFEPEYKYQAHVKLPDTKKDKKSEGDEGTKFFSVLTRKVRKDKKEIPKSWITVMK